MPTPPTAAQAPQRLAGVVVSGSLRGAVWPVELFNFSAFVNQEFIVPGNRFFLGLVAAAVAEVDGWPCLTIFWCRSGWTVW